MRLHVRIPRPRRNTEERERDENRKTEGEFPRSGKPEKTEEREGKEEYPI
jgi:hypothetical protein